MHTTSVDEHRRAHSVALGDILHRLVLLAHDVRLVLSPLFVSVVKGCVGEQNELVSSNTFRVKQCACTYYITVSRSLSKRA